jgi:hypothetical protein
VADYNDRRYHESIDPRPMSTLGAEKGSNVKPSPNAACSINGKPHNIVNRSQEPLLI